jgi:hypothetical protein
MADRRADVQHRFDLLALEGLAVVGSAAGAGVVFALGTQHQYAPEIPDGPGRLRGRVFHAARRAVRQGQ